MSSGTLMNVNGEQENIWIMEYKSSYPYVRIVENLAQKPMK